MKTAIVLALWLMCAYATCAHGQTSQSDQAHSEVECPTPTTINWSPSNADGVKALVAELKSWATAGADCPGRPLVKDEHGKPVPLSSAMAKAWLPGWEAAIPSFEQADAYLKSPQFAKTICAMGNEKGNAARLIGVPASSLVVGPSYKNNLSGSTLICGYSISPGTLSEADFNVVFMGLNPHNIEDFQSLNVQQVPTGAQSLYELTPPATSQH